ncbi:MAG: glycosyltransferase [Betaproteobacteria bacterium]|nr:glycosyltransferase [Betaproteobacteria bacterium]
MANLTAQLQELLRREGADVRVVQTNAPYRPHWVGGVRGVRALFRLVPYVLSLIRTSRSVDIVHVMANSGWSWYLFATPAVWIASLSGTPVVVNYHGGDAERFLARSARRIVPTMRRATLLTVPSGFLRSVFSRYGLDSTVVPNVIDLSVFRRVATQRQEHTAEPRFAVTRNLEAIYDVATAIRAFALLVARLPGARLFVAGTGPERAALEALARELDVQEAVTFTGRLDRSAIAELLAGTDVVLNPSRIDNAPVSIIEALASGVPVVSTNVGGIPFLVEDGRTALLVPPGEPEAMARAALAILQDAELRTRLVARGLEEVGRYSWENVREAMRATYDECLLRRSAAPAH